MQYTYRVHRFTLSQDSKTVNGSTLDENKSNSFFDETVTADDADTAKASLVAKYGDSTQARIFLRSVA